MIKIRDKIILAFEIGLCVSPIIGAVKFLIWHADKINTRADICNTACGDKRIKIDYDNKCYCLNGKDWIYKLELEDK